MKNLSILYLSVVFIAFSCKKGDNNYLTSTDTLMYTGSMALDDWEWVVAIDSIRYHPVNLREDFKINDERTVTLKYTLTDGNFTCLYPTGKLPEIRIAHIKFQ